MTHDVLAVFEKTLIAASLRRRPGFFQFVESSVGKSQNQLVEFFIEIVALGQQAQAFLFVRPAGSSVMLPSPVKTAPVTFPLTGATKQTVPDRNLKAATSR